MKYLVLYEFSRNVYEKFEIEAKTKGLAEMRAFELIWRCSESNFQDRCANDPDYVAQCIQIVEYNKILKIPNDKIQEMIKNLSKSQFTYVPLENVLKPSNGKKCLENKYLIINDEKCVSTIYGRIECFHDKDDAEDFKNEWFPNCKIKKYEMIYV